MVKSLLERFEGPKGRARRVEALLGMRMVSGNPVLAEELADTVEMRLVAPDDVLIEQGDDTDEVFLIFSGICSIAVNNCIVARRGRGEQVGEMAALQPSQRRSATVTATEEMLVGVLSADELDDVATRHPGIYKSFAKELAVRLLQRNAFVNEYREKIRVFIISSVEALPIARAVVNAFEHDAFQVQLWTDGVFKVTNYTLQSLEDAVDRSDFAIAIAHPDDKTTGRQDQEWPSPRDNVIFELGLFMGRLGRARAILMEPRGANVKLPSDLAGIQTIPYKYESGCDVDAMMSPACNRLRDHILALGANNG
jgi:CRP/FNR family cyclic AMP-dependent transcriptional regulator